MITGVAPEILGTVELFAALQEAEQQKLAEQCEWLLLRAGALIARAGDQWGALFVVVSGQVRLVDDRVQPVPVTIDVLSEGSAFGEATLLDKTGGGFSAYSQTDAVLLKLDREALKRGIGSDPEMARALDDYQKQRAVRTFLRTTTVFGALSPRQLQLLVRSLEKRHAAAGDVVIRQGDEADGLYIIEKGRLRVYREADPSHALAALESGAVVGEIALLRGERRTASAVAETLTTVWFLPKETFGTLLEQNAELTSSFATLVRERMGPEAAPPAAEKPEEGGARDAAPTAGARGAGPATARVPPLLRIQPPLLLEIGIASLLAQLLYLLLPVFAKFVLDDVIAVRDDRWIWTVAAGMGVAAVLSLLAALCRSYLSHHTAQGAEQKLLRTVWRQVLRLPVRFFDRRASDEIAARLADAGVLTRFQVQTAAGLATDTIAALLYLGLMLHYSGRLGAMALLLALANAALLWAGTRRERECESAADPKLRQDAYLRESLARLRTIRLLGAEVFVRWEFEARLVRAANSARRLLNRVLAAETASRFFSHASATVVLFYGAWMVLQGRLTAGELVACMILAPGLTAPLRGAPRLLEARREMKQASTRLAELLSQEREPQAAAAEYQAEGRQITRPSAARGCQPGAIRFEDVWFRYQEGGRYVLQGFDCEIPAGQRVALLGRSGCGKSTVVKLLMGFYEPVFGRITLDGVDLRDLPREELRRRIGVVLQQPFLFRGTVRGNIARGAPRAALSDIVIAAQRAGAHDFISSLPQGYETPLDGQGANLSGGQKQRIMIAQTLVRDPEVMIFDEATSALDLEAERFFLYNLDTAYRGRTTVLVSPRPRTARTADLILVVDGGRVAEQGTDQQLSAGQGLYRTLIS